MLSYHGKLVIYVQDTKRHPTVILTHIVSDFNSICNVQVLFVYVFVFRDTIQKKKNLVICNLFSLQPLLEDVWQAVRHMYFILSSV